MPPVRRVEIGAILNGFELDSMDALLYICLRLTYHQGFFRQMVPDPYIFGKLSARRFDCCIVRLQQRSFRLFIARSIFFTLTVSPYGGLE